MTVRVQDLAAGDQIKAWMRTGFALEVTVVTSGVWYVSPPKSKRAKANALVKFIGTVIENDSTRGELTVAVLDTPAKGYGGRPSRTNALAIVPYKTMKSCRKRSVAAEPGRPADQIPNRPGLRRPGRVAKGAGSAIGYYTEVLVTR